MPPFPAAPPPMRVTISKWGNSLGIRIPRGLAEDAHLAEGTTLDLRVENGRLVAEPVEEVTLASLLAGVTADNLHHPQLDDAPRGAEAW